MVRVGPVLADGSEVRVILHQQRDADVGERLRQARLAPAGHVRDRRDAVRRRIDDPGHSQRDRPQWARDRRADASQGLVGEREQVSWRRARWRVARRPGQDLPAQVTGLDAQLRAADVDCDDPADAGSDVEELGPSPSRRYVGSGLDDEPSREELVHGERHGRRARAQQPAQLRARQRPLREDRVERARRDVQLAKDVVVAALHRLDCETTLLCAILGRVRAR